MALGSLAALTPVELVFMEKKKKKNHPRMVTPGRPACWRKHGGTQGWACVRTGASGHLVRPDAGHLDRPHLSLAYTGPTLPIAL